MPVPAAAHRFSGSNRWVKPHAHHHGDEDVRKMTRQLVQAFSRYVSHMDDYGLSQETKENSGETNRHFGSRSKCQRAILKNS
jgi:hypothetical protein